MVDCNRTEAVSEASGALGMDDQQKRHSARPVARARMRPRCTISRAPARVGQCLTFGFRDPRSRLNAGISGKNALNTRESAAPRTRLQ